MTPTNDGGNAGTGDAASRSETSLPSPFKDGDVMYMVHFQKSHTRRYDDAEEMAQDIKGWLRLHPKRKVTVELYV